MLCLRPSRQDEMFAHRPTLNHVSDGTYESLRFIRSILKPSTGALFSPEHRYPALFVSLRDQAPTTNTGQGAWRITFSITCSPKNRSRDPFLVVRVLMGQICFMCARKNDVSCELSLSSLTLIAGPLPHTQEQKYRAGSLTISGDHLPGP